MKSAIQAAVKTSYFQYGLKAENIEKIVTAIESRLSAVGTIEPEKLQDAINEAVELYKPALALIQSEVDSRSKKTPEPPAPPAPPTPPSADSETAALLKTLMEKITGLESKDAEQRKTATKQEIVSKAIELAKKQGATNDVLLQKAVKLTAFSDDMTPEQLSGLAVAEYNELQSSISKDGAVPIIPALGDKATVEAAQKKGVEMADKYLGVKPKPA